jgi:hypothetical protein
MAATTLQSPPTTTAPTRRSWARPQAVCFETRAEITAYAGSVKWNGR